MYREEKSNNHLMFLLITDDFPCLIIKNKLKRPKIIIEIDVNLIPIKGKIATKKIE